MNKHTRAAVEALAESHEPSSRLLHAVDEVQTEMELMEVLARAYLLMARENILLSRALDESAALISFRSKFDVLP